MFKILKSILKIGNIEDLENKQTSTKKIQEINDYTRQYDPLNIDSIDKDDYLGLAASAKHRAKIALKDKDYDLAWELFHDQKKYLYKHGQKYNFDIRNMQALEGDISENLANILRLEGYHSDALVHILFSISTNPGVQSKMKKLPAYFKRTKFNMNFEEVLQYVYTLQTSDEVIFSDIQEKVKKWMI